MEIEYVGLATVIVSERKRSLKFLSKVNWFKKDMKKKFIGIETTQIQPSNNCSI